VQELGESVGFELFFGPRDLERQLGEPLVAVFFPKFPHDELEVLDPGGRHLMLQGGQYSPHLTIVNVGR